MLSPDAFFVVVSCSWSGKSMLARDKFGPSPKISWLLGDYWCAELVCSHVWKKGQQNRKLHADFCRDSNFCMYMFRGAMTFETFVWFELTWFYMLQLSGRLWPGCLINLCWHTLHPSRLQPIYLGQHLWTCTRLCGPTTLWVVENRPCIGEGHERDDVETCLCKPFPLCIHHESLPNLCTYFFRISLQITY